MRWVSTYERTTVGAERKMMVVERKELCDCLACLTGLGSHMLPNCRVRP